MMMFSLQRACEIQIMAQAAGGNSQLINISDAVLATVPEYIKQVTRGAGTGLVMARALAKKWTVSTPGIGSNCTNRGCHLYA